MLPAMVEIALSYKTWWVVVATKSKVGKFLALFFTVFLRFGVGRARKDSKTFLWNLLKFH